MTEKKPKSPLEHYMRAQELLDEIDDGTEARRPEWYTVQIAIAHLHLRAAEVGAALRRKLRPTVVDSISAAILSQPVAGSAPAAMTPGQVAGIVQETIQAEKRRGTIR